uniref:Uncharacterized protein n=1 Tax=Arundo donax TaxID=35708 RepID=A0A0A9FM82_ARUDO
MVITRELAGESFWMFEKKNSDCKVHINKTFCFDH